MSLDIKKFLFWVATGFNILLFMKGIMLYYDPSLWWLGFYTPIYAAWLFYTGGFIFFYMKKELETGITSKLWFVFFVVFISFWLRQKTYINADCSLLVGIVEMPFYLVNHPLDLFVYLYNYFWLI